MALEFVATYLNEIYLFDYLGKHDFFPIRLLYCCVLINISDTHSIDVIDSKQAFWTQNEHLEPRVRFNVADTCSENNLNKPINVKTNAYCCMDKQPASQA